MKSFSNTYIFVFSTIMVVVVAALLSTAAMVLQPLQEKNIEIQKILFPILYFSMYKTKIGIPAMQKFADKFRKPLHWLSYVSIAVGFLGMGIIFFSLAHIMFLRKDVR